MTKYIIYFHPKQHTPQHKQLSDYWSKCRVFLNEGKIRRNQALTYPFHVTLTGFFTHDNPQQVAQYAKEIFSEVFDHHYKSNCTLVTDIQFYETTNLIGLQLQSPLVVEGIERLLEKESMLRAPSKDNLHMTLAHMFELKDKPCLESLIKSSIDLSKWTGEWSVMMWQVSSDHKEWNTYSVIV